MFLDTITEVKIPKMFLWFTEQWELQFLHDRENWIRVLTRVVTNVGTEQALHQSTLCIVVRAEYRVPGSQSTRAKCQQSIHIVCAGPVWSCSVPDDFESRHEYDIPYHIVETQKQICIWNIQMYIDTTKGISRVKWRDSQSDNFFVFRSFPVYTVYQFTVHLF